MRGRNLTLRRQLRPDAAATAARDASAITLQQRIKSYVGISTRVAIGQPGSIEGSLGKAKRIVDKRTLLA